MFPIFDFDPVPKSAAAYSCSGTVLAFDNANNAARKAPTLLMEGGLVGQLARVRYGPRSLRVFGTDTDDVERVAELVRDLHPPIAAGLQLAVQTLENLPGGNCRLFPRRLPVRQFFPDLIWLGAFPLDELRQRSDDEFERAAYVVFE